MTIRPSIAMTQKVSSVRRHAKPDDKHPLPATLNIEFESKLKATDLEKIPLSQDTDKKARIPASGQSPLVKNGGLSRTISGGVKNATTKLDLPPPQVAVRNLVELARYGHLCTMMSQMHHRRAGYPFGTVVDFATDGAGYPIFMLSSLSIHARNVSENPKCSFVVQMPGWTNLANARVTIFGDVKKVSAEEQELACEIFSVKSSALPSQKQRWVTGNYVYYRMTRIVDIYFVGGFGTVQWISPKDYLSASPDAIVLDHPATTLQALNSRYSHSLCSLLKIGGRTAIEATFISVDATGADVRVKSETGELFVERVGFNRRVETINDALAVVGEAVETLSSGSTDVTA
eukprot:CAMPEP_0175041930 /NCGR_PEP_ID=MMETSP0052_2-20121109/2230_1 /TAXON_ID=51329 ORGANISM="Polytomella parva, Strain SAG 63-3" /NCGR_SAMPLE_ID=MMETSP0052_2 /ASSEMBLY_ACC=CAM_ASM_000194 /LENGTH=345 /DNA_ID=CAMNT_0016304583 /DNA_START=142 /DNA_END=1179 /DNA_ORIENTATION=-